MEPVMKKKLIIVSCLLSMISTCVSAYESYELPGETYSYLMNFYDIGEHTGIDDDGKEVIGTNYIYNNNKIPLFESAKNWAVVINGSKATKPVSFAVLGINDYNAMAASLYTNVAELPYKVSNVNARINHLTVTKNPYPTSFPADGIIMVGKGVNPDAHGWATFSGFHSLYHGTIPDFNAVITHEIMHALGLNTYATSFFDDIGDENIYFSQGPNDSLGIYDKDLRIYTGDMSQTFDSKYEVVPRSGIAVAKGKEFDIFKYSPYYVGKETLKVLAGKNDYDDARQAIIDNGGLTNYSGYYSVSEKPNVYGLPIHPMDGDEEESEIDMAHIELRNSYMSHQDYRNWLIPMEAELAVLKDLGYNIDLRKYFGKSYYLNNITDTYTGGYSEWNGSAYTRNPSGVTQGVGIHIYGDNNNITQASDILTVGEGAFGVRIDGVGNTYTLSNGSKINADGKENIALGVTWGKEHTINVDSGSVVTAKGENGIAASFDFGANLFGTLSDARGSYIKYMADFELNGTPEESTQAELVSDFNVSGTLEGEKAAIYISDNAHVKNINLKDGAVINGDIISEWNSISSDPNAKVQKFNGLYWDNIKPGNEAEYYYTDLNTTGSTKINGDIDGDNGINNTLRLNNSGNLDITGEKIAVNSAENTANITLNDAELSIQKGKLTGNGNLNIGAALKLNANVTDIENTVNLKSESLLSTINATKQTTNINKINSDNGKLSFDLGDKINLGENSDSGKDKIRISQVKADKTQVKALKDNAAYKLFANPSKTLDLGNSKANVYYKGNKYTLTQDKTSKDLLNAKITATGVELKDAAEDSTAANYIVTEDKLTKNAGTVKGDDFEISGNDVNVNGHKGLVIDGAQNKNGTILKTGIFGASDSNITVKNNGVVAIDGSDKIINLGQKGETAIKLNNGSVVLSAENNFININGAIKGSDNKKDIINSFGNLVSFSDTSNVGINVNNKILFINGKSTNTVWDINSPYTKVANDSFLASNGSNEIVFGNGMLDLTNNKATDITLSKMTLKDTLSTAIDVDLKTLSADRFVFKNSLDLDTNGNFLDIAKINLLNQNAVLSDKNITIPIISNKYHNEGFLGGIKHSVPQKGIMTPIFKYNFGFEENENTAGFVLTRGSSSDYHTFNPAVMAAPVAAQVGGYLSQLNSYDEAFRNLDMKMLMTREERKAYKLANLYASEVQPRVFSPTYLPEKDSAGWFRPYASFEKVNLKNGPKVGNNMYGSYFGGDSKMYETKNGWDYQYSVYVGYNGSHQHYQGNSIYQNGGNLGATGVWYKGDFFTALTANVGANVAEASTMYGHEDFPMLMTGIASKTGYNWELAKGKFIIQPSYLMSYSFVNTFDYTNNAGVRIKSDPINAINIAPGVKFIGNLKHGWQPYIGVQIVWNIMDKTDFQAANVNLPDLSVKPYVQYGVGLQKRWGERFTGFFQTMIRNGGRNGVALSLGFRWALGKDSKK